MNKLQNSLSNIYIYYILSLYLQHVSKNNLKKYKNINQKKKYACVENIHSVKEHLPGVNKKYIKSQLILTDVI